MPALHIRLPYFFFLNKIRILPFSSLLDFYPSWTTDVENWEPLCKETDRFQQVFYNKFNQSTVFQIAQLKQVKYYPLQ